MDMTNFYADLKYMIDHIFCDQETTVRRWSQVICKDYQIPLAIASGFLRRITTTPPSVPVELIFRDHPEMLAAKDIVLNSHLSEILKFDTAKNCLTYREEIPVKLRHEIAEFCWNNSSIIFD